MARNFVFGQRKGFLSNNCAERKPFYFSAESDAFGLSKFFGFQNPFFKKGFGGGAGAEPPHTPAPLQKQRAFLAALSGVGKGSRQEREIRYQGMGLLLGIVLPHGDEIDALLF
jgi:hypothetical protein